MNSVNREKKGCKFDLNNIPLDSDMQEFIDSIDGVEELKEFICQPLQPDPFLKYSFPFYEKLIRNSLALMPRQSFGNDFAAAESLALMQEVGEGQFNVKWTLSVPFIKGKNAENIAELFYKIEQFVIRPKIRDLVAQDNLRRGVPLGNLLEITKRIGLPEKEANEVIKALNYGSQIELGIRIESARKRYEETNLCEEKLFKFYNIHFSTPAKISNNSNHNKNNKSKFGKFINESSKKKSKQLNEKIIIYPSPTYLSILLAANEILGVPLEDIFTKNASSLDLRVQEIQMLLVALNPNINLEQTNTIETIAALTPIKVENLQKNSPI